MINIKIKGTDLDRTKKVDEYTKRFIIALRKDDFTYNEIAKMLDLSPTCIRYHCLDQEQKNSLLEGNKRRKKDWYYNLSIDERRSFANKWKDSHNKYLKELYETKLNNV